MFGVSYNNTTHTNIIQYNVTTSVCLKCMYTEPKRNSGPTPKEILCKYMQLFVYLWESVKSHTLNKRIKYIFLKYTSSTFLEYKH